MTRAQIRSLLHGHGIPADGPYLAYVLMHAELELLICSGGLDGKQQTYALVDERVGATLPLRGDAALAELTRRYFGSHGPASVKDFTWWASLTVGEARRGIELVGAELERTEVEGRTYWSAPARRQGRIDRPVAHLLQCFDEYIVGYPESRDVLDVRSLAGFRVGGRPKANHALFIDSQIVGFWGRTLTRRALTIELQLVRQLDDGEHRAIDAAVAAYGRFAGLPASWHGAS
jgi:hypothetical protein